MKTDRFIRAALLGLALGFGQIAVAPMVHAETVVEAFNLGADGIMVLG